MSEALTASVTTINKNDLIVICRTLILKTVAYILFLSTHGTFIKIGHMLGHKASLDKFYMTKIILNMFTEHSKIRI